MEQLHDIAMKKAVEESKNNLKNNYKKGGPFGAVIVKNGKIISSAHNTVIEKHDATAHAEVNAIRKACKKLKTHDLSGCILYTSAEPCPMCLSAIIWANIKKVYYGNTKEDAAEIGFRDDYLYDFIGGIIKNEHDKNILDLISLGREETIKEFNIFKNNENKTIY